MKPTFWLLRGLKFILFAALFIALVAYITMSLWNWLVPELFHGPFISMWQALGLLGLTRILFGGWGRGGRAGWARHRRQWKQKMESRLGHLTPEEREKFRQKMEGACAGPAWMRRKTTEDSHSSTV